MKFLGGGGSIHSCAAPELTVPLSLLKLTGRHDSRLLQNEHIKNNSLQKVTVGFKYMNTILMA